MQIFLNEHSTGSKQSSPSSNPDNILNWTEADDEKTQEDIVCEEVYLELLNKDSR
jgi:hypothetical protein